MRLLRRVRAALLRPGPVWITAAVTLIVINLYGRWGPALLSLASTGGTGGTGGLEAGNVTVRKAWVSGLFTLLLASLVLLPIAAMAIGVRNLIDGYRLADRRRVLWLIAGAATAAWMIVVPLLFLPFLVLTDLDSGWVLFAGGLLWCLAPVVLVIATAIALFYSGAVDPALVLRRSTVYGLLGAAAFVLFTTLENVLSHWFEATLGLPGLAGSILAGLISAVLLLPLQRYLSRVTAHNATPSETVT